MHGILLEDLGVAKWVAAGQGGAELRQRTGSDDRAREPTAESGIWIANGRGHVAELEGIIDWYLERFLCYLGG